MGKTWKSVVQRCNFPCVSQFRGPQGSSGLLTSCSVSVPVVVDPFDVQMAWRGYVLEALASHGGMAVSIHQWETGHRGELSGQMPGGGSAMLIVQCTYTVSCGVGAHGVTRISLCPSAVGSAFKLHAPRLRLCFLVRPAFDTPFPEGSALEEK